MPEKTLVLRKDNHWYVINSASGDEEEILLTLLSYSENKSFNLEEQEVLQLVDRLGYTLEVYDGVDAA